MRCSASQTFVISVSSRSVRDRMLLWIDVSTKPPISRTLFCSSSSSWTRSRIGLIKRYQLQDLADVTSAWSAGESPGPYDGKTGFSLLYSNFPNIRGSEAFRRPLPRKLRGGFRLRLTVSVWRQKDVQIELRDLVAQPNDQLLKAGIRGLRRGRVQRRLIEHRMTRRPNFRRQHPSVFLQQGGLPGDADIRIRHHAPNDFDRLLAAHRVLN